MMHARDRRSAGTDPQGAKKCLFDLFNSLSLGAAGGKKIFDPILKII